MITYQVEKYQACVEDIKPLLVGHWEEIALHKDKIKLNPDYSKYKMMADMGLLMVITVRDEGSLIGYCVLFIHTHPHYIDHIFAVHDILFLLPEYRKSFIGAKMLEFTEQELRKIGVSVMTVGMKVHSPFDELCVQRGFENIERIYSKYIGD